MEKRSFNLLEWPYGNLGLFVESGPVVFHSHPDPKDRMNRILLANPIVRKKLGCDGIPSPAVYCDASNPAALLQQYGRTEKSPATPAVSGDGASL